MVGVVLRIHVTQCCTAYGLHHMSMDDRLHCFIDDTSMAATMLPVPPDSLWMQGSGASMWTDGTVSRTRSSLAWRALPLWRSRCFSWASHQIDTPQNI